MRDYHVVRVNYLGGIASPGELRNLLEILKSCEVADLRFGLRQQAVFKVSFLHEKTFFQRMEAAEIDYYIHANPHPNVVSSYVAEEVFQRGNWLSEGIYKDIFDGFDFNPKLKVNISDNAQSFTPFFSGHINFISSEKPNFWYLYFRQPKSNELIAYDNLLFSTELAEISKKIEANVLENKDPFYALPELISSPVKQELKLPKFTLPYYEGFNRYGKKSWLGIYRRNETFRVSFLLDLCNLCISTKIGEICITPWKSIIIKNIDTKDRKNWSSLLAKHDINVRHAANELNWQIEDDSPLALKLKSRLVKYFNKMDLRTFGICLGIKTVPRTEVFASIMVNRRKLLNLIPVYDITYTLDYDPNGRKVAYFAKGIPGFQLSERLRKSVLAFNENISNKTIFEIPESKEQATSELETTSIHECGNCQTIYQKEYGDVFNQIEPGTDFDDLPDHYVCPVCFSEKEQFVIKEKLLSWLEEHA
ncbi:rubredoxin [Jiulongibacter sediminis]|uniref:Rubredoxin-like domain-containing protein n=1 Tax=Jiulongibacter sediminis TaxID=1605367 RepID=A0A0P7C342_9BACT|nr:rubredoxin [Jiulongibacter sediminis]KPM48633.1 hypothetical protein AFM12_08490 [Jiulongibacter sediminis]TBX25170.1 hypothetical protein TK44_08495 [Jiulongibacter sediminis]